MLFINENLKTKLTVKEDGQGGLLFDLYEVASNLEYDRQTRAIQTFLANHVELENRGPWAGGSLLVEGVIHLFLLKSNMERYNEIYKR